MQPAQRLSQNGKYALAAFQLILIAAAMVVFFPFNAENPGYHIDFDVYWTGTRFFLNGGYICLLYTSPSPRDRQKSRMPSSA